MDRLQAIPAATLLGLYPSLEALDVAEFAELCRPEAIISVPAGTQLFSERQPCAGFPLLLSGSIKVVKSAPTGRELLLYRVAPGGSCVISSSCLLGHTAYTAHGIAEVPVQMLVLPAVRFESLMATNASFRDFVFHLLADRMVELMQLIEAVAFQRLDQRLAKLLLGKSEPIQITHQTLADELGSVREIISRMLKAFSEQGLVVLGREQISVSDRAGLQQIAGIVR